MVMAGGRDGGWWMVGMVMVDGSDGDNVPSSDLVLTVN